MSGAPVKQRDGWHASHNPREALWAAVLELGVEDARRGDGRARAWLRSDDFLEVATLAGLEADEAMAAQERLAAEIERDPAMA